MPSSGGAAIQVTNTAGTLAIESPDGRDLYFVAATERPSPPWRVPAAGGPPVKVLDGVMFGNFRRGRTGHLLHRLSVGRLGRFFTDRPGGETRLRYFDLETKRVSTVARDLGWVLLG